jgi:dihydrofolate reductase
MGRIISYMFTTVDGFIAGPNGEFDDFEPGEEEMAFANSLFRSCDGVMFGRKIFEFFVPYWDTFEEENPGARASDKEFARIFQGLERVVFSRTLPAAENARLIKDDAITREVPRLKQESGDYLLVCGPELLGSLARHGLVDEYMLMIRPAVRGNGMALFGTIPEEMPLRLVATQTFASGVVLHHYTAVNDGARPPSARD